MPKGLVYQRRFPFSFHLSLLHTRWHCRLLKINTTRTAPQRITSLKNKQTPTSENNGSLRVLQLLLRLLQRLLCLQKLWSAYFLTSCPPCGRPSEISYFNLLPCPSTPCLPLLPLLAGKPSCPVLLFLALPRQLFDHIQHKPPPFPQFLLRFPPTTALCVIPSSPRLRVS